MRSRRGPGGEFVDAAAKYCRLIERHRKTSQRGLLRGIAVALAQVYATGVRLPTTHARHQAKTRYRTHAQWQKLYNSLSRKLGRYRVYRSVFDPYERDAAAGSGNLADDLADIYWDVKPGLVDCLSGWKGALEAAVWHWQFKMRFHWGRHAVDAMKALDELRSRYEI
jgi:uncharacterized protein DUF5063